MISIWFRKVMSSNRNIDRLMIIALIIILYTGLWILSLAWKNANILIEILTAIIAYIYISKNIPWDVAKKVKRINYLVEDRKSYKALEKYNKLLYEGLTRGENYKEEIYRDIKLGQGRCFLDIGITEGKKDALFDAIESLNEVLNSYQKENNLSVYAQVLYNIGTAYMVLAQISNYEAYILKSIEFYSMADKALSNRKNSHILFVVKMQLGYSYEILSKYQDESQNLKSSLDNFMQAKNITLPGKKIKIFLLFMDIIISRVMLELDKLDQSDRYTQIAIRNLDGAIESLSGIVRKYPLKYFPVDFAGIQVHIGTAYFELSKIRNNKDYEEKGKMAFKEALKVCREDRYPVLYKKAMEYMNSLDETQELSFNNDGKTI